MKVVTREVIDKVTFSKEEINAFENLRNIIRECCNAYSDDCGNCPFADNDCGGFDSCDFLSNIINYFKDEDED